MQADFGVQRCSVVALYIRAKNSLGVLTTHLHPVNSKHLVHEHRQSGFY